MLKPDEKKDKKDAKLLILSKKQTKEITDYMISRRANGADDVTIRAEVFKKFKIDLTLYEFKWEPLDANGKKGVDNDKQLIRSSEIKKTREITPYKHEFSDGEIRAKAEALSNANMDIIALEEEKKSVVSDYKSKIDAKQAQVNELSRIIHSGFEIRKAELEIVKDFGTGTKKGYLEGECVLTEKLTAADHVQKIEFPA